MNIQDLLEERDVSHGEFSTYARISQGLKAVMREAFLLGECQARIMSAVQVEALEMIALKIARILTGDPNHIDHWDDIAGYATLVGNDLRKRAKSAEGNSGE